MVKKNLAIYFHAIWFLTVLAGMSVISGCERKGLEVNRWLDRKQSGQNRVSNKPVIIRVFLSRETQIWVQCQGGDCTIWDLTSDKPVSWVSQNHNFLVTTRDGRWQLQDESGQTLIHQTLPVNTTLEIRPQEQALLSCGTDKPFRYRGILRCIAENDGRFVLVNVIDMENYLKGVVGSEMYAYWHMAALRAQSIASRTYALYQMNNTKESRAQWDIGNTQSSQVYKGVNWESTRVTQAVDDTRGIVLTCGQPGNEKLIPAYYSSICGGHTQNARSVFGQDLEPLKGTQCPYCRSTSRPDLYRWNIEIPKEEINTRLIAVYPNLSELDRIIDIKVIQRSNVGRIQLLSLLGSNGKQRRVPAEDFRLAVSTRDKPLRSSWYNLVDTGENWRFEDGHGWGHGVGLCQHGCQGMAKLGKDCIEILNHYYPEARMFRVY